LVDLEGEGADRGPTEQNLRHLRKTESPEPQALPVNETHAQN
jgi:hypothetical protein